MLLVSSVCVSLLLFASLDTPDAFLMSPVERVAHTFSKTLFNTSEVRTFFGGEVQLQKQFIMVSTDCLQSLIDFSCKSAAGCYSIKLKTIPSQCSVSVFVELPPTEGKLDKQPMIYSVICVFIQLSCLKILLARSWGAGR